MNEGKNGAGARGVPVELDRVRRLFYPMNAIRQIEERFGVNFVAGGTIERVGLADFSWLILLGLEHEQPAPPAWWERILAALKIRPVDEPLTAEALEGIVSVEDLERIGDAMAKALGAGDKKKGNSPAAS